MKGGCLMNVSEHKHHKKHGVVLNTNPSLHHFLIPLTLEVEKSNITICPTITIYKRIVKKSWGSSCSLSLETDNALW